MKKTNLTIHDIAAALGISKSTVSRALRDKHDISAETRAKVMAYAQARDYQPSHTARSLRSRSTRTIGVIVPAYNIPFYSIAIAGVQDYAMAQGYNVMVCHSNEQSEVERRNVDALLSAGVEGLIISVASDNEENDHIHKLKRKGVPLVMFNRVIEDFRCAKVVVDDYYGAKKMVEHLLDTGCRNIAHIGGPENIVLSTNRRQAYLDAVKEQGLEKGPDWIFQGDFTTQGGIRGMQVLLDRLRSIDAVFCVCDAVAFGAMKVIKSRGKRIPWDIAVAGFTNEPLSELVEPALSTVAQPIYEIGESASRLLFSQLGNPEIPPEFCVLNTHLEIRGSTR